jgi:hypothetical protein
MGFVVRAEFLFCFPVGTAAVFIRVDDRPLPNYLTPRKTRLKNQVIGYKKCFGSDFLP